MNDRTSRVSDATINAWASDASLTKQVAARLARELRSAPQWLPVGTERDIARRMNVSNTTISQAKRLLAGHGVIIKHGTQYYVA